VFQELRDTCFYFGAAAICRAIPIVVKDVSMKVYLLLLVALSLSACSWFQRAPVHAESESVAPLQVPENLDQPARDPALAVPSGQTAVLPRDAQVPPEIDADGVARAANQVTVSRLEISTALDPDSAYKKALATIKDHDEYEITYRNADTRLLQVSHEQVTRKGRWWLLGAGKRTRKQNFAINIESKTEGTVVTVTDGAGDATANPVAQSLHDHLANALK
jgi:uncharacterized lipoprotein